MLILWVRKADNLEQIRKFVPRGGLLDDLVNLRKYLEQVEERSVRTVFKDYLGEKNLESSILLKMYIKKTVGECNSFSFDKRLDFFRIRAFEKWNVLLSEEFSSVKQDVFEQNSRCPSINWARG